MAFHDVLFPENISYGSRGGPSFKTEIIELDSGQERRVSRWSQPKHKYNASYGVRTYDDLAALKEFYMARDGALHSFRFRNHLDYRTPAGVSLTRNPELLERLWTETGISPGAITVSDWGRWYDLRCFVETNFGAQAAVTVKIYKISDTLGRGKPAEATL